MQRIHFQRTSGAEFHFVPKGAAIISLLLPINTRICALKGAPEPYLSLYHFCGFEVSSVSGKPAGTARVTNYQFVIF